MDEGCARAAARVRARAPGPPAALASGLLTALLLLGAARQARASDLDFQVATGGSGMWIRTMPALQNQATSTSARDVPARDVPIGGSVTAIGGSFDLGLTIDDHWVVPGFGFGAYAAVGQYATIITSVDGSIARVRPWTTYAVDLLLPGIGYRVKQRRFLFSAALRTGLGFLHTSSAIAAGGEQVISDLSGRTPMLLAELEACRRLDPLTRVCLQVAPRLYYFDIMNGATVGVRIEWGR